MSWENDLKSALRDLDVPEHGPEFWIGLERRLGQEESVGHHAMPPNRRWRAPAAMVAVLSAFALVLTIALPTSLTPTVLAYAYPQGTYTYEVSYLDATVLESFGDGPWEPGPDSSTEAVGILAYTVEEDEGEGTTTIGIRADATLVSNLDGTSVVAVDLRFVLDADGDLVRILDPGPDSGFPAFVLPDPLPGSSRYAGLPFGFGPSFPSHPVEVGDSWTTSGPRSMFAEAGPNFTATHTVVRAETRAGRDTLVITSVYETPVAHVDHPDDTDVTRSSYGPESVTVTVWFDSAAGIIVRAEVNRTWTSRTVFESGQTLVSNGSSQMVIQLIGG